jgi:hypothetical protein
LLIRRQRQMCIRDRYNIDVKISDALDEDDIISETWKHEKKFFGNYWKT